MHWCKAVIPQFRYDCRPNEGGLAQARLAKQGGERILPNTTQDLGDLGIAPEEECSVRLLKREQAQPGMLRINERSLL
jgi:hypothetical protein